MAVKSKLFIAIALSVILHQCSTFGNQHLKEFLSVKRQQTLIHVLPVKVPADISFLYSISSTQVKKENVKEEIDRFKSFYATWFYAETLQNLERAGFQIVPKDRADLILNMEIVDLAEIRPKMFIQGLSIGLVFGWIAGEVTGNPDVGLAVFLLEVIEEFAVLYILKLYFLVSTISLEVLDKEGEILYQSEFTSYGDENYLKNLSSAKKDLRQNKVKSSLFQNSQSVADFLKKTRMGENIFF